MDGSKKSKTGLITLSLQGGSRAWLQINQLSDVEQHFLQVPV